MKINELIKLKPMDKFFIMVDGCLDKVAKDGILAIYFGSLEPDTEKYEVKISREYLVEDTTTVHGCNIFKTIGDVVYYILNTIDKSYSDVISEDSEVCEGFKALCELINIKDSHFKED